MVCIIDCHQKERRCKILNDAVIYDEAEIYGEFKTWGVPL